MNNELHTEEYSEGSLTLLAKALVPEIIDFYNSELGKKYYEKWLKAHPEYQDEKMIA